MTKLKLFLDSAFDTETQELLKDNVKLDGQTTNPSLVAKNLGNSKLTEAELLAEYRSIVTKISNLLPDGSVSIEVPADANMSTEDILEYALEMNTWIPNAHIKLPITASGLEAARDLTTLGISVNMTLCFSQEQAMAVHSATAGAAPGQVYISPFIGRLDDIGLNGADLIANIRQMYNELDSHVEILAASIRSVEHIHAAQAAGADIVTAGAENIAKYDENKECKTTPNDLEPIPFQELNYKKGFDKYNIQHDLTDKGLAKFDEDWKGLLK